MEEGTGSDGPFPYKRCAEFDVEGLQGLAFKKPSAYGASQLKFILERKEGIRITEKAANSNTNPDTNNSLHTATTSNTTAILHSSTIPVPSTNLDLNSSLHSPMTEIILEPIDTSELNSHSEPTTSQPSTASYPKPIPNVDSNINSSPDNIESADLTIPHICDTPRSSTSTSRLYTEDQSGSSSTKVRKPARFKPKFGRGKP